MGNINKIPHGCPIVIPIDNGVVKDIGVFPGDDQTSSFRVPHQIVFAFATQQAICPDRLHQRLDQSVAHWGLVTVFSSLRDDCFVGKARVGSLHFHLCGNLWCMGGKIVMVLVFSCLKLEAR